MIHDEESRVHLLEAQVHSMKELSIANHLTQQLHGRHVTLAPILIGAG